MSHCKTHGEIYVEYDGNTGAPIDGYCYQCHIDQLKIDLEFAYKRAKVLADILHIPIHESLGVTGTILGLVRGKAERIQSYYQAVDNALACWEMIPTGDAKADLNKLLCIEQQVAIDPAVSDSARALQKQTALECLEILDTADWATSSYEETFYQAVAAIKEKFGVGE